LVFWQPFWIQNGRHSKPTMDINLQHNKLLGNKFRPNRRIFVFWRPFWIQNGRHSKPKWSPYGAACLTSCKYPFPLKNFYIFEFLTIFSIFILAAILKIPRLECTS
jgi:hypothetical protein